MAKIFYYYPIFSEATDAQLRAVADTCSAVPPDDGDDWDAASAEASRSATSAASMEWDFCGWSQIAALAAEELAIRDGSDPLPESGDPTADRAAALTVGRCYACGSICTDDHAANLPRAVRDAPDPIRAAAACVAWTARAYPALGVDEAAYLRALARGAADCITAWDADPAPAAARIAAEAEAIVADAVGAAQTAIITPSA